MKKYIFILLAVATLGGCTNEYNYPNHGYVARPDNTVVVRHPATTVVRTPNAVVVR